MPTPVDPMSAISLAAQPHGPSIEGWEDLSSSVIDSFDLTTLRERLNFANQHIKTLSSSIIALRTNSAHYLLQHKILEMETTEAAARHQVESEITRREVEVLRLDQSSFNATQQLALAEENEAYKRRLRKAKRSIKDYRDELGDFKDENERLKKRIRDNRQHQLDASRSPENRHVTAGGGNGDKGVDYSGVHNSTTAAEINVPARRVSGVGGRGTAEDDGLEALRFLASQVLSQEIDEDTCHVDAGRVTTPQPKLKKPTTSDSTHHSIRRTLMSPVAFTSSSTSRSKKRRHSRDSTISASDIDGDISDINEGGKRRRTGTATNISHHSITRQRRCTHSPHPTPTMSLINEHRNNRRHHADTGANTSSLRTMPPGTPESPLERDGKVRDAGSGLGLGLRRGPGSEGIISPP